MPTTTSKFDEELARLPATYEAAFTHDLEKLKRAIAGASQNSIIAVGSGGSYTTASLFCSLHEAFTGRVSRPSTPLEIVCNPNLAAASPVFLISAEGKNSDVIQALQRARFYSARAIQILTNRRASPLISAAETLSDVNIHLFELQQKDGFLATNSLLFDAILIARAYSELDGNRSTLPGQISELGLQDGSVQAWMSHNSHLLRDAAKRRGIIVVYSPNFRSVAFDLESKLSESALLFCQLADLRSFAHGRHLWLTERPDDCTIVALVDEPLLPLWNRMQQFLPETVQRATLRFSGSQPADLVTGLIAAMHMVQQLAQSAGRDVGVADVSGEMRQLHYLDYTDLISPPDLSDIRPEHSKAEVLGASWPHQSAADRLKATLTECRSDLEARAFKAVVFDYDGTLVRSRRDDAPPPQSIVEQLLKLLDAGIIIGD